MLLVRYQYGMQIQYDIPREVGADRIVNAVAGFEKHRCPLIIVDFWHATTFDYCERQGGILAVVPLHRAWPFRWRPVPACSSKTAAGG